MDPALLAVPEGATKGAKKTTKGGSGASGEDPNSFTNQRRRVLRGVMEGANKTADDGHYGVGVDGVVDVDEYSGSDAGGSTPGRRSSRTRGGRRSESHGTMVGGNDDDDDDDDDDGGFVMPSILPTYATHGGAFGASSTSARGTRGGGGKSGSTATASSVAAEAHNGAQYDKHRTALMSAKAIERARLEDRKRDREAYKEDLLGAIGPALLQCVRCRASLSEWMSDDDSVRIQEVYEREVMRFLTNAFAHDRNATSGKGEPPKPQVWCPKCVDFIGRTRCPLCPSTAASAAPPPHPSANTARFTPEGLEAPAVSPLPLIRCLKCRNGYHGSCLGFDDATTIGLGSLSGFGKYCCPRCSLESAVVEVKGTTATKGSVDAAGKGGAVSRRGTR